MSQGPQQAHTNWTLLSISEAGPEADLPSPDFGTLAVHGRFCSAVFSRELFSCFALQLPSKLLKTTGSWWVREAMLPFKPDLPELHRLVFGIERRPIDQFSKPLMQRNH